MAAVEFKGGAALDPKEIAAWSSQKLREDATVRLARNVVTRLDAKEALIDHERNTETALVFSHRVTPQPPVTNQKRSGRCWIFAALNVLRNAMMRGDLKLSKDFELSQSFLIFYDKLERCNYVLHNILDTADQESGDREIAHLLQNPMEDGGQFAMLQSLICKYGIVPQSAWPETHASGNTFRMNNLINSKLREFAKELRDMKRGGSASNAEIDRRRAEMVTALHQVLVVFLGAPPTHFNWAYYDKDDKYHEEMDLTPQSFYKKFVPLKLEDYVSVIHDPRNEYYKLYTVARLGNVVGTDLPVRYINLPMHELKRLTRATIERGEPVWFGCDVGKNFFRDRGVLDPKLFTFDLTFGTRCELSKTDRLHYGESLMTHAMMFSAFHAPGEQASGKRWELSEQESASVSDDADAPPRWNVTQYRVENTWGKDIGDSGYLTMSDEWFSEYVYQLAIDRTLLSDRARQVLEQPVVVLPPWDPMGALAK